MNTYFKIFKYITYYMLLVSLLFMLFSLLVHKPLNILIFTFNFIIWILIYTYLKKQTHRAFILSYILVNILWIPILYRTINRILFIFENGGMERADGSGSPMAFLLGIIFEQIFFIPLTIVWIYGLYFILFKRDK